MANRISETKDQIKAFTKALETKTALMDQASSAWDIDDKGNVSMTTDQHQAFASAVEEAERIKGTILLMEKSIGLHEFSDGVPGQRGDAAASDATEQARSRGVQTKGLSDLLYDSEEWQALEAKGFKGEPYAVASADFGLSSIATKDIYSTMAGEVPINALGTPQNLDLTPRMLRPGRVRDLFPKETTTANLLYGIRESGFINRAAVVSERRAADGVSNPTGASSDVFGLKPN